MNPYIREYQESKYDTKIVENVDNFKHYGNPGELKLFHMNVRSIAKNFDELLTFQDYLSVNFDIIVLSETFQINNTEFYHMNGYRSIYSHGTLNKNDGVYSLRQKRYRIYSQYNRSG